MAAEAENLSDSQSEVSNASDELTSLESSISDSDSDSKNCNSSQSAGKRKALPNRPSVSHNKEQQKERKNRTKKNCR